MHRSAQPLIFLLLLTGPSSPAQSPAERSTAKAVKKPVPTRPVIDAAAAAFKAGSAAYAKGDLAGAHAGFAKSVRLAPNVGAGHSALGAVLLAQDALRPALAELLRARELDPNDAGAIINLAQTYLRLGDFPASVATFRLLPATPDGASYPLRPEESVPFAVALSGTGDDAAARQVLEQALASNPGSAAIEDALGTVLAHTQQMNEASSHFERALQLDPTLASAHFHLGSVMLLEGRSKEAVAELFRAFALDGAREEYALQLGKALGADGQDEQAISVLRQALAHHARSIDTEYALALALQAAGRPKEALPHFEAVVAARPGDAAALTNDALALVQTGEARSAISLYARALADGGESATLREDLGVAYLQLNELDRALEEFRKGLAIDGASPHLHYDLALALKLKDKPSEAIPEFLEAERLDPNLPDPPYTLGVLYMQLGRFPEAQAKLLRATELRPDNGEAWALLGNVYKQDNQIAPAKLALARASQLLPQQPGPHISMAAILSAEGDSAGAAAERKTAAELSRVAYAHQKSTFSVESGRALLAKGDLTGAVTQLEAAIAAEPKLPEPHLLLAEALTRQHKPADAALERNRARDLVEAASRPPQP